MIKVTYCVVCACRYGVQFLLQVIYIITHIYSVNVNMNLGEKVFFLVWRETKYIFKSIYNIVIS